MARMSLNRRGTTLRLLAAIMLALAVFAFFAANMLALSSPNVGLLKTVAPWSGATVSKEAELLVQQARGAGDIPTVRAAATAALRREPMDFEAARSLGSIAIREEKPRLGRTIFTTIGKQTLREPVTHLWLLGDTYEREDDAAFLREAEILFRHRPALAPQIYALFAAMVDEGAVTDRFIERLGEDPDWRPGFFGTMGETAKNSERIADVYTRTAKTTVPPRADELRVWLLYELSRGNPAAARDYWRKFQRPLLPAREKLIRNPDFEGSVAPQPFDWTFFRSESSFGEIGASPDGRGQALYVEMNGRENTEVAMQLLDLPAGRYRLDGRIYPVTDLSRREMIMSLGCTAKTNFSPVGRKILDAGVERWSPVSWTFEVPAGCTIQRLGIGMEPGALNAELAAYFDDFSLTELGG